MNVEQNNALHESGQLPIEQCYMQPFLFFNADCMDIMRQYPDKYFDLAIVDPPYNIASQQKRGVGSRIDKSGKMNNWNNATPPPEYFIELFRVSKGQVIWGANNYILPVTEYFCIWNKHQTVENFASAEYAWVSPSLKTPAKVFDMTIHKHNQTKGEKIHPTMKPVDLYDWLIHNYAKHNQKILDTHLGSGSIALAIDKANKLDNMNLEFVGVELDSEYYNAALNRFRLAHAQSCLSF